jgi:hypothetical protein
VKDAKRKTYLCLSVARCICDNKSNQQEFHSPLCHYIDIIVCVTLKAKSIKRRQRNKATLCATINYSSKEKRLVPHDEKVEIHIRKLNKAMRRARRDVVITFSPAAAEIA